MTKKSKVVKEVQINEIDLHLNELKGKSAKIRYLNSIGWDRTKISKKLEIRYQHVRNVLVTQLKKDIK